MEDKLEAQFCPLYLAIKNNSHLHAGHKSAKEHGGGHFAITIVSNKFEQLNKIKRHQLIYGVFKDDFKQSIHALQIKAYSQKEWENKKQ